MSEDSSRPAKRARQACEGCRRKKTRCPGEQPACSLCVRLGQVCAYTDWSSGRTLETDQSISDQLRRLESKMDMMISGNFGQPPPQALGQVSAPEAAWSTASSSSELLPNASHTSLFPDERTANELVALFCEKCNCQPLPLFPPGLSTVYDLRDEELVNAVLAIAVRLSPNSNSPDTTGSLAARHAKRATELVTKKLCDGGIGLSTIQTLCLLSFWELSSGQKERARLHLDTALWLAQESRLTEEPSWHIIPLELEERRRCAWSLYILGRTSGMRPPLLDSGDCPFTCRFPDDPRELTQLDDLPEEPRRDTGIVIANNIRLYDIWEKVQNFAGRSHSEAGKSLWTGNSEYGSIISALMDYESQFPDEHRFDQRKHVEETSEIFKDNPTYWAPWFSIQFMYHAILCVLNHPFLLSLRLDPIRESSPRTFRQTTAEQAKLHSSWAFRFIAVAQRWQYAVTDPLIAYAVTVAATIFDHYRLSGDPIARRDAYDKFTKCVAFVREVSKIWPIAAQMVRLLTKLERSTTAQPPATSDYSNERAETLWTLLSYSAVSASCSPPEPSLFSQSLLPEHARQSQRLVVAPRSHLNLGTFAVTPSRPTSRAREMRAQDNQAGITPDSNANSTEPLTPDARQFEQSLQNSLLDDIMGASFEWWDAGNL